MVVLVCWTARVRHRGFSAAGFLPSYLVRVAGLTPADAFTANLVAILLQAGSALAGGYLADRFPLRRVAIAIMAGIAVTVVPGFLLITTTHTLTGALVGQGVWAIFIGASYSVGAVLAIRMFRRLSASPPSRSPSTSASRCSAAPAVRVHLAGGRHRQLPLAPAVYLAVAAVGRPAGGRRRPARPIATHPAHPSDAGDPGSVALASGIGRGLTSLRRSSLRSLTLAARHCDGSDGVVVRSETMPRTQVARGSVVRSRDACICGSRRQFGR
jgi:hypothetical protein